MRRTPLRLSVSPPREVTTPRSRRLERPLAGLAALLSLGGAGMMMGAHGLQVARIKAELGEVTNPLDVVDGIAGLAAHDTIGLALQVLGPELAPVGIIPTRRCAGAGGVGLGLALLLARAQITGLDAEAASADAGGLGKGHRGHS